MNFRLFINVVLSVFLTAILLISMPQQTRAQVTYKTFIYTSDALSSEIQDLSNENSSRGGYLGTLGSAVVDAGKGIAGGYVTSFIDMGVNAIASLITRPSRLKQEWE